MEATLATHGPHAARRWGLPKRKEYEAGFSPMTAGQLGELMEQLRVVAKQGIKFVWIDWCVQSVQLVQWQGPAKSSRHATVVVANALPVHRRRTLDDPCTHGWGQRGVRMMTQVKAAWLSTHWGCVPHDSDVFS